MRIYSRLGALLLVLSMCIAASYPAHEFHLSKSTVNYDTETNAIQVTLRIFIDDLETALATDGIKGLKIGTGTEVDSADYFVSAYIADHFVLTTAADTLLYQYLGKELSDDLQAIWCYLELPLEDGLPTGEDITLHNTILLKDFADQKNVVTVKKDKKRLADYLLGIDDYEAALKF